MKHKLASLSKRPIKVGPVVWDFATMSSGQYTVLYDPHTHSLEQFFPGAASEGKVMIVVTKIGKSYFISNHPGSPPLSPQHKANVLVPLIQQLDPQNAGITF